MPRSSEHKSQATHNECLLHEGLFDLPNTLYCDWVVTISFYVAVHLIDSTLASEHRCFNICSHDDRRRLVKDYLSKGAKNVFTLFEALYSDSRRARYDCLTMTAQNASDAVNVLKQIKKILA